MTEAEELLNRAKKLRREVEALRKESEELDVIRKKANEQHKQLMKKLAEFEAYFAKKKT